MYVESADKTIQIRTGNPTYSKSDDGRFQTFFSSVASPAADGVRSAFRLACAFLGIPYVSMTGFSGFDTEFGFKF